MKRYSVLLVIFGLMSSHASLAAESYDSCDGFIETLPATISTQGTWCLRGNLSTSIASGNAISITTNNVTIDCNGFKIGGLAGGPATQANGIHAQDRVNVGVRNCNVRGFLNAVLLQAFSGGGNYLVEDSSVDGATAVGIRVGGDGSIVRNNLVRDIGGTTFYVDEPTGIYTNGSTDVLNNMVDSVSGTAGAYGIRTVLNSGGSVSHNRVRGIVQMGVGTAVGIYNYASGRMSLRDNDVSGDGTTGISCTDSQARAKGNILVGFDVGMSGCGDAGGNDVAPR